MKKLLRFILVSLQSLLLLACQQQDNAPTQLQKIKQLGVLKVLTRIDPTTYYHSPKGLSGMEYDLVQLFAKRIGVRAEFIIPATFDDIMRQITRNKADIAAAGITITKERQHYLRFSPPYQVITEQLLYHASHPAPKDLGEVNDGILEIVKNTSHAETLSNLQREYPQLEWITNDEIDSNGLIYLLNTGLIDYTLSDSNQIELIHRFYPNVEVAFDLGDPQQLGWALPKTTDLSLFIEVTKFFLEIRKNGTLERLIERYYGHTSRMDDFSNCKFREHFRTRLPKYQALFEAAAKTYKLDWRLLAAIGYQESHWQENVSSATGVRGLMMLTQDAATQVGISNRDNAKQSIMGGSQYFIQSIEKISPTIQEPDRTWFALAAYNIGIGHLEDARELTREQQGNPDKWLDVKKRLPLLRQEKWYKRTKFGFARGDEPVTYIESIRSYYDLLVWYTTPSNPMKNNAMQDRAEIPTNNALSINSPLL